MPSVKASIAARHERAQMLAHILTTTLDKVPGLRDALPRLRDLEVSLRERGLASLNDAPLPNAEQIRAQLVRLAPADSPEIRNARVQLLSSLDRRSKPRSRQLPTYASNEGVFAGEATLSQFMEELQRQEQR